MKDDILITDKLPVSHYLNIKKKLSYEQHKIQFDILSKREYACQLMCGSQELHVECNNQIADDLVGWEFLLRNIEMTFEIVQIKILNEHPV